VITFFVLGFAGVFFLGFTFFMVIEIVSSGLQIVITSGLLLTGGFLFGLGFDGSLVDLVTLFGALISFGCFLETIFGLK
jgi:hypothetical protein